MSDPRDKRPAEEEDDAPLDEQDDEAVRALLRRTLGAGAEGKETAPPPDLLRGVQRKIRQRSKGKFYGDGWSTSQTKVNYALIALVMLVLVAIVYFTLGPMGLSAR